MNPQGQSERRHPEGVSMEEEEILAEVNNATAGIVPEQPIEPAEEVEETQQEPEAPKEDFYKKQYENLLPDYTRKSQKLAELEKINIEPKVEQPEWTKPDWQPKTWQEATEAGKQAALREIAPLLNEVQQAKQQREATEQARQVADAEMAEIKVLNPKVNEDLVYQHATKYGFPSLKSAYQNLIDMQGLQKTTQQKVLRNLNQRNSEPVGVSGATTPVDDTPSYQEIAGFKSIRSAASAALAQLKGK